MVFLFSVEEATSSHRNQAKRNFKTAVVFAQQHYKLNVICNVVESQGGAHFDQLPHDVLVLIAENVSWKDICNLRLVSKRLKAAVMDASISLKPAKDFRANQLNSLMECFGEISSLDLSGCHNLGAPFLLSLPAHLPNLSGLRIPGNWVAFPGSPDLHALFPQLRKLALNSSRGITALPQAILRLASLESLALECCGNLAQLPEEISQLSALRKLKIWGCCYMRTLPEGLSLLSSLRKLEIRSCQSMSPLPAILWALSGLHVLTLRSCPLQGGLPDSITGVLSFHIICVISFLIWKGFLQDIAKLLSAVYGACGCVRAGYVFSSKSICILCLISGKGSSSVRVHICDRGRLLILWAIYAVIFSHFAV